jgi:hypothetical protein
VQRIITKLGYIDFSSQSRADVAKMLSVRGTRTYCCSSPFKATGVVRTIPPVVRHSICQIFIDTQMALVDKPHLGTGSILQPRENGKSPLQLGPVNNASDPWRCSFFWNRCISPRGLSHFQICSKRAPDLTHLS